jgi:hypothetical protein
MHAALEINLPSYASTIVATDDLIADRDIDGTLPDYSADALFFSAEGVIRRRDAIRAMFENCAASSQNQAYPLRRSSDSSKATTYTSPGLRRLLTILMSLQATRL